MAFYTGLRMPDVFGKVLSQSGALNIESRDFVGVDLVRHGQMRRLDILLEDNRWMHALLQKQGYAVTYHEFSAGHDYTA